MLGAAMGCWAIIGQSASRRHDASAVRGQPIEQ